MKKRATKKAAKLKAGRKRLLAARKRERELQKIEKALGEDFENLAQARRALKEQTKPEGGTIDSLDDWENMQDYATETGQEELGGGVHYGE